MNESARRVTVKGGEYVVYRRENDFKIAFSVYSPAASGDPDITKINLGVDGLWRLFTLPLTKYKRNDDVISHLDRLAARTRFREALMTPNLTGKEALAAAMAKLKAAGIPRSNTAIGKFCTAEAEIIREIVLQAYPEASEAIPYGLSLIICKPDAAMPELALQPKPAVASAAAPINPPLLIEPEKKTKIRSQIAAFPGFA